MEKRKQDQKALIGMIVNIVDFILEDLILLDRELLFSITRKDFDISFFSGTGAGGQHRNKHQNCVRLLHRDSKVTATGQSNKRRAANLREAFKGLIKTRE